MNEAVTGASGLEAARDAVSRWAWREAFELYAAADAAEPLGPDDLNSMAECAWWIGKMRHCIALRERAHAAYLKDGNPRRAAFVAVDLSDHHGDLGELSDAEVWINKASRLLETQPEGAEHGWLNFGLSNLRRHQGDMASAFVFAQEAEVLGGRHQDKDLFALAHAFTGIGVAHMEDLERGLAMVEEATQGAVAGELGPRATGWIYCMMIAINAQIADWQTAGHWSEAATNWCNRQAINGFPGVCRVHRAEIMRLRGAFADAEEEARVATTELSSFNLSFTAMAFRELGDVRVKMGQLDAAEDAFRQATEMGLSPQPGMALLLAARGRTQAAATQLRRTLADTSLAPLDRAKILPAQVDVALSLDDVETARGSAEELVGIADAYPGSPALRATADVATAAVALADGRLDVAEQQARDARKRFDEVDLCYESAKASVLLGQIHRARGEAEAARSELTSALTTFDNIGAVPDATRTRELVAAI